MLHNLYNQSVKYIFSLFIALPTELFIYGGSKYIIPVFFKTESQAFAVLSSIPISDATDVAINSCPVLAAKADTNLIYFHL